MEWLTTRQAAHRLGVKVPTLYAYVSRGTLQSQRSAHGRESRFDAREVEALALRGRPRSASRSPSLDIQIHTRITDISDHTIRFRGHDAVQLATSHTFEQVAELIWTGELGRLPTGHEGVWSGEVIHAEADHLGDHLRLVAAVVAASATEHRLDDASVTAEGRQLIATLVDSLPVAGDGRCPRLVLADGTTVRGTLAGRLWARLTPRRSTPQLMATLNAALVLLADHEMAASALAARVAASTRAGAHGVVAAGMGTLSGALHGRESERARRVLARAGDEPTLRAIEAAVDHYGRLPGFGHPLYPKGDPRAALLMQMLHAGGPNPALDLVDRLCEGARRRGIPPPNVDLALAALGLVAGMPPDAGEAIFTPARVVGWLAHAMEEYRERPVRFRPRAVYIGVPAIEG